MDYDFRNKTGPPYGGNAVPMYGQAAPSPSPASGHPMYGPSGYPRIGQQGQGYGGFPPTGPARTSSHHQSPSSTSSGLGIKVTIKPEYRITPPPQLLPMPQVGDISRSNFQYDFSLERKILAEAEKENPDWGKLGLENLSSRAPETTPAMGSDPVVSKYFASGLNREAVPIAVANYGDNPTKVRDFANGYGILREMGFSSDMVAEALFMHENDTDKALAYLLHGSS